MLNADVLANLIDSNLINAGAKGRNRNKFSKALAAGIVSYLVGKTFLTFDTGNGTGGIGTGIGIIALDGSNMANIAFNSMPSHGKNAQKMWNAIMSAVHSHLQDSTLLTTTNPSVGTGIGNIVIGSFQIDVGGLQASIDSALIQVGAKGKNRSKLSFCCANGIVTDILSHGTGIVVISGSVLPPSTSGTGTGIIS